MLNFDQGVRTDSEEFDAAVLSTAHIMLSDMIMADIRENAQRLGAVAKRLSDDFPGEGYEKVLSFALALSQIKTDGVRTTGVFGNGPVH